MALWPRRCSVHSRGPLAARTAGLPHFDGRPGVLALTCPHLRSGGASRLSKDAEPRYGQPGRMQHARPHPFRAEPPTMPYPGMGSALQVVLRHCNNRQRAMPVLKVWQAQAGAGRRNLKAPKMGVSKGRSKTT